MVTAKPRKKQENMPTAKINDMKVKRPPRTIKEKKFVKEYLKSGNATEAAQKVYDVSNYNSAHAIGSQNVQKLTIVDIMEKNGLTDDLIASTLRQAMKAKGEKGTPEWNARLKATELTSKIKGHLREKIEHSGFIGVIPILGGKTKENV